MQYIIRMTLFFSNSRIQLLDSSYVYSLDITHKAKNYKLGITVQSALIAVFCLLAISHEIMAVCSKTFLPFMEKEKRLSKNKWLARGHKSVEHQTTEQNMPDKFSLKLSRT